MNDYGALAVNGYRWVNIHGPYASTTEKAVERLTNYRAGPTEAQIIEDDEAYYLIPGTIVQIIKEEPANGMSQVQLGGFSSFLWTYSRFLSKHPIWDEEGKSGEELFFELALEDLRQAAHLFLRTYEATCGVDGWVSLEVSPLLAHDTRATLAKAEELYTRANRRNLYIKIPGTQEGLPAIKEAIFAGVPVNVTLLFSPEQYVAAAEAYVRGIERRIAAGLRPGVSSVASAFVSRWDGAVTGKVSEALNNRLGIAIGKCAYKAYRALMESARWQRIFNAGGASAATSIRKHGNKGSQGI